MQKSDHFTLKNVKLVLKSRGRKPLNYKISQNRRKAIFRPKMANFRPFLGGNRLLAALTVLRAFCKKTAHARPVKSVIKPHACRFFEKNTIFFDKQRPKNFGTGSGFEIFKKYPDFHPTHKNCLPQACKKQNFKLRQPKNWVL